MGRDVAEEAFRLAASGGAICFLGAGFSRGAVDSDGKNVPSTSDLEREIRELIGLSGDSSSLSDLADYCEESAELARKLKILLIKRLTLLTPQPYHRSILNVPWRAVFTTNFDDIPEVCLPASGVVTFTPTSSSLSAVRKTPVYYLHGRARDILEQDCDPALVISERNYVNLRDENKNLYSRLTNEIACAKAIILFGYSLKDLAIAQIFLSVSEDIRNKTYIICAPDEGEIGLSRLKKYGAVASIGTEAAGELASIVSSELSQRAEPTFLEVYAPQLADQRDVEIADIERLIITGSFDPSAYEQQMRDQRGEALYCVERIDAIAAVLDNKSAIRRFVVTSNLGNGKSLFLEQLAYKAYRRGINVYRISTNITEIYDELELVLQRSEPAIFIIDDVVRYRAIAKFVGARLSNLATLICTTRGEAEHAIFDVRTTDLGGAVTEIDLDQLSLTEIRAWDALLERWGLWEGQIADPVQKRERFLQRDCGGENRAIVLSIFRRSSISEKIDNIVSYFVRQRDGNGRAFAAILIMSLCQQHVRWSDIVRWCKIDEASLKRDIETSEVFGFMQRSHGCWYLITSSQLAAYILNAKSNRIDRATIVDIYTKIVRETAFSANDGRSGFDYRENLKELMRYRFLTRLFGDHEDALLLIASVYKALSAVPRIRSYDQFWLQYGMSRMEAGDLVNAERYLNDALGIARGKGEGYSPYQIIDQLVRLLFQKNSQIADRFSRKEVDDAIKYTRERLAKVDSEIIYQYRAIPHILTFVEQHAESIDVILRNDLISVVEQILSVGENKSAHGAKKGEILALRKAGQEVLRVLRFI